MDKYPLRPKTPQEGKGYIDFATALKWCNEAFFDGFISAHLETADELEKLTIEERINYYFRAVEKCAVLRRETPPELNFFGGGGRVIALIPYRLLEGIVAPLRGGVAVC